MSIQTPTSSTQPNVPTDLTEHPSASSLARPNYPAVTLPNGSANATPYPTESRPLIPMPSPRLPIELISKILIILQSQDRPSLARCCRVNTQLFELSSPLLYRRIVLSDNPKIDSRLDCSPNKLRRNGAINPHTRKRKLLLNAEDITIYNHPQISCNTKGLKYLKLHTLRIILRPTPNGHGIHHTLTSAISISNNDRSATCSYLSGLTPRRLIIVISGPSPAISPRPGPIPIDGSFKIFKEAKEICIVVSHSMEAAHLYRKINIPSSCIPNIEKVTIIVPDISPIPVIVTPTPWNLSDRGFLDQFHDFIHNLLQIEFLGDKPIEIVTCQEYLFSPPQAAAETLQKRKHPWEQLMEEAAIWIVGSLMKFREVGPSDENRRIMWEEVGKIVARFRFIHMREYFREYDIQDLVGCTASTGVKRSANDEVTEGGEIQGFGMGSE